MANTPRKLPRQEVLRWLLRYDPETGALSWRPRPADMFGGDERACRWWNSRFAGKPALQHVGNHGYRKGSLFRRPVLAHRIIWKMLTGDEPESIDHINGDRTDNRERNLRSIPAADNARNRAINKNNTSGVLGVYWYRPSRKWRAAIHDPVGYRQVHLGTFTSKAEAIAARKRAEMEYDYHENHGREVAA